MGRDEGCEWAVEWEKKKKKKDFQGLTFGMDGGD